MANNIETVDMPLKAIGNGVNVPILGLGFGSWQVSDDAETIEEAVELGLRAGYRHFDTTPHNDKAIGKVIAQWIASGKVKREDLFIVSKLPPSAMWPYRVNEYLREALRSLQMSYVDLYLIQFPVGVSTTDEGVSLERTHLEPIWTAMEQEVKVGRTKTIGLCDFNREQVQRILQIAKIRPALLQTEINVYFQQKDVQIFCRKMNIALCAYAPLGLQDMTETDTHNDLREYEDHKVTKDPVVVQLARKYGKTPTQILLRFLIQSDIIAIPKCLNPYDLKTTIKAVSFKLEMYEMKLLQNLDKPDKEHMSRVILNTIFQGVAEDHPEFPWTK